jgi:hypothetical protein
VDTERELADHTLLATLSVDVYARIAPDLERVELEVRRGPCDRAPALDTRHATRWTRYRTRGMLP